MHDEQTAPSHVTTAALRSPVWTEVAHEESGVDQMTRTIWSVNRAMVEQAFERGAILKAKRRRGDVMTVVIKARTPHLNSRARVG